LLSVEENITLDEVETLEAKLPEKLSETEAQELLKSIDPQAIREDESPTFALTARGIRGFRGGSLGHRHTWHRGFAPRWRGSWSNYLYYPVGGYYFPYVYSAGNYWRYRSTYSPFFYYWNNSYTPFYRARWW
jgi:hypothetical protein